MDIQLSKYLEAVSLPSLYIIILTKAPKVQAPILGDVWGSGRWARMTQMLYVRTCEKLHPSGTKKR